MIGVVSESLGGYRSGRYTRTRLEEGASSDVEAPDSQRRDLIGMRPAQANKGSVDLGMDEPFAAKPIPSQLLKG